MQITLSMYKAVEFFVLFSAEEQDEDENSEESEEEDSEEDLTERFTESPYGHIPPPPLWVQGNQGLSMSGRGGVSLHQT